MRLDKKNVSGRLRLILWRGIHGQADVVADVDEAVIERVLGEGLRAEARAEVEHARLRDA